MNELHKAACVGATKRTLAALARGVIDINQGTWDGSTPLMHAAGLGHLQVVRVLLHKGADTSVVNDDGSAALHLTTQRGCLAVTNELVKAGAALEAKTAKEGCTSLDLAAERNHWEVVKLLIEAGANPNCRRLDGSTPLYSAAYRGHMATIKVLVRAKADPLLTARSSNLPRMTFVPLDVAAQNGHLEIVHKLIQEHGIQGCGGASGGVCALQGAAEKQHVSIMELLASVGVVDSGEGLSGAACCGNESSAKFLLQQWKRNTSGGGAAYLETRDREGKTPLLYSIQACSPRVARMLVDAGADATTAVRLTASDGSGMEVFNDAPVAFAEMFLADKVLGDKIATESQLHGLEAIRRLLMRVEAVHAVSWLWANDAAFAHAAVEGTGTATEATSTPLVSMLPTLRRRAGRPRVLLAALFRWVVITHPRKPCSLCLLGVGI